MAQTPKRGRLRPGSTIGGRYRVLDFIGSGTVGAVFRASDAELDNEVVALKCLHPHLASDEQTLQRFKNEVMVCRQLSHPNIVRLYDFHRVEDELYFIAMEYILGLNLREYLDTLPRRQPAFADAVRVLSHIAAALAFAHEKRILHRDLKPENILLNLAGEAKLGDFGLAGNLQASLGLTATGELLGSPAYMAPELFSGLKPDMCSDIYALGAVGYELVAGAPPFEEKTFLQLAERHLNEPFPETRLVEAGAPPWFLTFVERCSAKDRTARFQNSAQILDFLDRHGAQELRERRVTISAAGRTRVRAGGYFTPARRLRLSAAMLLLVLIVPVLQFTDGNSQARYLREVFLLEKTLNRALPLLKRPLGLADVSALDADCLFQALERRSAAGVEGLLPFAALDRRTADGRTALHLAAATGQSFSVAKLLRAGMPPQVKDNAGEMPLHAALRNRQIEAARTLLAYGADPSASDANGSTLLHILAQLKNAGHYETVLPAVRSAKWWPRSRDGQTALGLSVINGDFASTEAMLRAGADPNDTDSRGRTALMLACLLDEPTAGSAGLELLLRWGADSEARDHDGRSARDYAAAAGLDLEALIKEISARQPGGG